MRALRTAFGFVLGLMLAGVPAAARAEGLSIPDPGLNAAIREALQKPNVRLTEQDLLGLTSLSASGRSISNLAGMEAARNLPSLSLGNGQD